MKKAIFLAVIFCSISISSFAFYGQISNSSYTYDNIYRATHQDYSLGSISHFHIHLDVDRNWGWIYIGDNRYWSPLATSVHADYTTKNGSIYHTYEIWENGGWDGTVNRDGATDVILGAGGTVSWTGGWYNNKASVSW